MFSLNVTVKRLFSHRKAISQHSYVRSNVTIPFQLLPHISDIQFYYQISKN